MKRSFVHQLEIPLFVLLAQAALAQPEPGAPFVEVTGESNIRYQVGYTLPSLSGLFAWQLGTATNGGAAAGDCDRDGDIDLFITYGNSGAPDGGGGPNRLYLNQLAEQGQGLKFVDIAEAAGVANTRSDGKGNDRHSGPTFADMDGDGDLDLFVGGIYGDPSRIYANQGNCHFGDVTSNSPEIEQMLAAHTVSATFGDYDLDGDLDMFLTHWGTLDELYGYPRERETDHLWRNDSDESGIRYVNASEETGLSDIAFLTRLEPFCGERDCPGGIGDLQIADFSFAASFGRINDDPWPDIVVAGDFATSQLAVNLGDGRFAALDNRILRDAQYGMGSSLGDIDNDGDLDWFVSSIFGPGNEWSIPRGNRLFLNAGGASLIIDDTDRLGVADGSFAWASCFLDIDNDADLDIYHTNGYAETIQANGEAYDDDASRAFIMNDEGTYTEQAAALGLDSRTSGRGVVCADFDNDGDTDILELTDAKPNSGRLWENRTAAAGNNFLRVRLEGLPPNTEAAGARIFVTTGEKRQMREIIIGSNFISQNPSVQIFGLGESDTVDEILVEWPGLDSGEGPEQLGTLLSGPVAATRPGQTLVLRHPSLPPP